MQILLSYSWEIFDTNIVKEIDFIRRMIKPCYRTIITIYVYFLLCKVQDRNKIILLSIGIRVWNLLYKLDQTGWLTSIWGYV